MIRKNNNTGNTIKLIINKLYGGKLNDDKRPKIKGTKYM